MLINKSIIICGIVRNADKNLRKNIPNIKQICSFFRNYKIILFENDSRDKTKEILHEWEESDKEHLYFRMEDSNSAPTIPASKKMGSNKFFCHKRIDRMAYLRNQYLDYIQANDLTADFLMVVDLDVERIYPEKVLDALSVNREWDAISAFGYSISPKLRIRYHDTYALTKWEDKDKDQTEEMIYNSNHSFDKYTEKDDWIRVYSAFGGLTIYKFEAVDGCRYFALDNDDNKVEVHCEHFSICKQMIERGFDKIYVVPAMRLCYQYPSLNLIFEKIKGRFSYR